MIRDFSKDESEATETGRDTELTLGGGTLLVLGLRTSCVVRSLLRLGIFCRTSRFARVGNGGIARRFEVHSGASRAQVRNPGPLGRRRFRPLTQAALAVSGDSSGNSTQPAQTIPTVAGGNTDSPEPQVKPALDAQVRPALSGQAVGVQPAPALQVQPAMTQVQGWMVQIAAVSHPEDAEVLVNALRKRGYAVTARRDVGDSLIHVQTGPFVNRNDANAMRQKLLSDGYNAIVQ